MRAFALVSFAVFVAVIAADGANAAALTDALVVQPDSRPLTSYKITDAAGGTSGGAPGTVSFTPNVSKLFRLEAGRNYIVTSTYKDSSCTITVALPATVRVTHDMFGKLSCARE